MTPVTDPVDACAPLPAAPGRALPVATRLRDYEITGLAGEGPFSIVYAAWDHSLQRKVAVKEYLPMALAARVAGSVAVTVPSNRHLDAFRAGLKSFVDEAKLLARFDHPSLVKVYRFWEENGTAYMVMPFCEGPTLQAALAELGHVPSESELRTWLRPVLNAVSVLHEGSVWHQNIGPDAIVLTPVGPVLFGFASAARAIAEAQHTPAAALKPAFAAIEQYGSEAAMPRGPWTDLYALAAVVYTAITGEEPAPSTERLGKDPVQPLALIAAGLYSDAFLAAIDASMRVRAETRPRDHLEFRALMGDIAPEAPVSLAPRRDLMQEPFIGLVNGKREITVPDRPLLAAAEPTLPPLPGGTARPRPSSTPARPSGSMPLPGNPIAPSWVRSARAGTALGKRAVYGIVAVTCFLVGAVALGFQFHLRQAAPAAAAAGRTAATPAATGRALPKAPLVATTPSTAAPAPAAVNVATPVAAIASGSPGAAPVLTAEVPTAAPAPAEPIEQARCIEILQKASLEQISVAETEFFKKECR